MSNLKVKYSQNCAVFENDPWKPKLPGFGAAWEVSSLWSQAACALCWMESDFSDFHRKWSSIHPFVHVTPKFMEDTIAGDG